MRSLRRLPRAKRPAGKRRRGVRPRVEEAERRLLLSGDVFLVDTAADSGPGSLRWAIEQVNAIATTDPGTIRFAISGAGPATIRPLSPLAPIARPVVVEARAADGSPSVRLDGSAAGPNANGLVVSGGGSVIAGLIVTGFAGSGIVLSGPGGDFVESCYVGLVPGAGAAAAATAPNGAGITIASASDETVGGDQGRGNVIAGNRGAGVLVVSANPGDSARNAVIGNWIGTDPDGAAGIGNGGDGVAFQGAADGMIRDNVVSGNLGNGIVLSARGSGNRIQGNLVGLVPDGSAVLGNGRDGVLVDDAPDAAILGNQISGNAGHGIESRKDSGGLRIQGNRIGVDPTGLIPLGNRLDGVRLGSDDAMVGGPEPSDGNVIAFNGRGTVGAGVQLVGAVHHDSILSNRIYGNAGLGINLGNGPVPDHEPAKTPPDQAVGPNDWTNRPILQTAFTDGETTTASGTLWGMAGRSYTIQFFWTGAPDPSGFGEGELYLGQAVVQTDDDGRTTFALPIGAGAADGFLTATATDEFGNTSEFAQTVPLTPRTDLHVEMTADPPSGPQGVPVTFTATVQNRGHLTAPYATLAMAFPAGSRILSITGGPGRAAADSGGDVLLSVGSLAPGATAALTVVVAPPAGFSGSFRATATATATMGLADADPGDETASAVSILSPAVDAALALADGPTSAHRGDVLRYVFTASNLGPSAATDARLFLPIPAGASFVAATGGTARLDGGLLVVDLGALAAGASVPVEIDLNADAVGVLSLAATLSTAGYDLDPGNQAAAVSTVVVGRVDLGVSIQAPTVVVAGRDLTYDVVIRNAGPDDARDVTVQDVLPAGVELVSATIDVGSITVADGVVAATLDSLAAGASTMLRLVVRPTVPAGALLRNSARVASAEDDGDPSNDAATTDTYVRDLSDLGVVVAVDAASVAAGGDAVYRVRARNDGPAAEPDAIVAIALPAGASLVSATSDRGDPAEIADGLAVFRLGGLAPGGEILATIVLTAATPGPLAITAVVGGLNVDENAANQRATAAVAVLPTVDLATWVDPPAAVFERAEFQYTLWAANLSTAATTGATLTAPLPDGVEFVSAAVAGGGTATLDGRDVVATLGTLAGSSKTAVTITVRPTAPAGTPLILSGVSAGDLPDPSPANDRGAYAVWVAPAVDLMLRLRPLETSVELGGDVTWVVDVWNSSLTTATGVSIAIPFGACGGFVGSATTQGTVAASDGVVTARVGTLAPRAYATIAFVLRPNDWGAATLVATATADQHVNLTAATTRAAALSVIEPAGALAFTASDVAVAETAGAAYLTVVRTDGARGTVSVAYRTTSGTAAAGVDYQPTSGVLTFQPGQTSATIAVPVFPYAHNRGDVSVGVVLEDPTGGATLGATSAAVVTVRDVDPDFVPPSVGRLNLLGAPNGIGGLSFTVSEPLNPASALDPRAYVVYDLGPAGIFGDGDDRPVPLLAPGYDPAAQTVYLSPVVPMAANHHYALVVRGAGPVAVTDLAGNALGGGVDYVALFTRGTALNYTDAAGNLVSLALANGGCMDLLRSASGDATLLTLQGIVPGRTTLSGAVARQRGRGSGVTPLGAIEGLGAFGDVRVALRTPPFLTTSLPSPPPRAVPLAPPPAPIRVASPMRRFPPMR